MLLFATPLAFILIVFCCMAFLYFIFFWSRCLCFFFMLWISVLTSLLLSFFCLQKLASSSSSHASKAVDSSKLSLAQPIAEKVVELLEVKSTTNLATNQTSKMHIQSWSSALSFVILMTTEGEIIWFFSSQSLSLLVLWKFLVVLCRMLEIWI